MRALVLFVTLLGCSSSTSATSSHSANELVSFHWKWSGLSPAGGTFDLDASCHFSSGGPLSYTTSVRSGSGVLPSAACDDLRRFIVSDAVLSAYATHGGKDGRCTGATDDYITSSIVLSNGETRSIGFENGSGCGTIEPFVTLVGKMKALGDTYATSTIDAGTD